MSETTEAVIITGRRRGKIVTLSDDLIAEGLPETSSDVSHLDPTMWAAINEALDGLFNAIDRVTSEVREATNALRPKLEKS